MGGTEKNQEKTDHTSVLLVGIGGTGRGALEAIRDKMNSFLEGEEESAEAE
jgi:hypothetical protein